jgi:hypothetical protein
LLGFGRTRLALASSYQLLLTHPALRSRTTLQEHSVIDGNLLPSAGCNDAVEPNQLASTDAAAASQDRMLEQEA